MVYCLVNRLGYIEGFVQDRSNSIANALEPLQSRTRPSIWPTHVQVILCFYPHNTHCQFNMFCHWLYTYPPQFKWRDWNRKGFIYPCDPYMIHVGSVHPCSKVIGIYFAVSNDGIYFQSINLKIFLFVDEVFCIYCGKYRECMLQRHACVDIEV